MSKVWPFDITVSPRGAFAAKADLIVRVDSEKTPDEMLANDGKIARRLIQDQRGVTLTKDYAIDAVEPVHPEYPGNDEHRVYYDLSEYRSGAAFQEIRSILRAIDRYLDEYGAGGPPRDLTDKDRELAKHLGDVATGLGLAIEALNRAENFA